MQIPESDRPLQYGWSMNAQTGLPTVNFLAPLFGYDEVELQSVYSSVRNMLDVCNGCSKDILAVALEAVNSNHSIPQQERNKLYTAYQSYSNGLEKALRFFHLANQLKRQVLPRFNLLGFYVHDQEGAKHKRGIWAEMAMEVAYDWATRYESNNYVGNQLRAAAGNNSVKIGLYKLSPDDYGDVINMGGQAPLKTIYHDPLWLLHNLSPGEEQAFASQRTSEGTDELVACFDWHGEAHSMLEMPTIYLEFGHLLKPSTRIMIHIPVLDDDGIFPEFKLIDPDAELEEEPRRAPTPTISAPPRRLPPPPPPPTRFLSHR